MPSIDRHRRGGQLLALTGATLSVLLIAAAGAGTSLGRHLDDAAVVRHTWDRTADPALRLPTVALLALTVGLAPLVAWHGRRDRGLLARLAVATVVAVLSSELLRSVMPAHAHDPLSGPSYPSGHAAAAMALSLALLSVTRGQRWARAAATAVPAAVAMLALIIPTHRPSDLVGGFVVAAVAVGMARRTAAAGAGNPEPARPEGSLAILLRSAVTTVVLISAAAVLLRRSHLRLTDLGPAFSVAIAGITVAAEVVVALFVRLPVAQPERRRGRGDHHGTGTDHDAAMARR